MYVHVREIVNFLESLYPCHWAEPWDRVGLVAGDLEWRVNRVRLAVDPTVAEAEAAAAIEGTFLVTHHPLLLKGAHFLTTGTGKGAVLTRLVRSGGSLWCGHTNADRSSVGTVGAWIDVLRLVDPKPLVEGPEQAESDGGPVPFGLGVVGRVEEPTRIDALSRRIAQAVPATAQGVVFTGDPGRVISTVAVCPGAGDAFLEDASRARVDAYITSDLRHHPALEHLESLGDHAQVPALVNLPHYASEFLFLPHLAKLLRDVFPQLPIEVSDISSDPFAGRA